MRAGRVAIMLFAGAAASAYSSGLSVAAGSPSVKVALPLKACLPGLPLPQQHLPLPTCCSHSSSRMARVGFPASASSMSTVRWNLNSSDSCFHACQWCPIVSSTVPAAQHTREGRKGTVAGSGSAVGGAGGAAGNGGLCWGCIRPAQGICMLAGQRRAHHPGRTPGLHKESRQGGA